MIAMQRSDKRSLRRYLLGETAPEEQNTIEQRLLSEQEYFDELVKIEEELTDEYVRGELEGAEKKDFERHFVAHPERRGRVEFARTLHDYLSRHRAGTSPSLVETGDALRERHAAWSTLAPAWRAAAGLAACFFLLLAGGAALLWRQSQHLQRQIEQVELQRSHAEEQQQELVRQIEQQVAQNNGLTAQFERQKDELMQLRRELARLLPAETESTMASLLLAPGLNRSPDQASVAVLSPSIQKLRLNLQVGGERYKAYRAALETVEGDVVSSDANLQSHMSGSNRVVTFVLAAALLNRSDYLVMLDGVSKDGSTEKVGTYYFKLVRKS